jgi:hypothetical protein
LARDIDKKQTDIIMPLMVTWPSPNLMPAKYMTDKLHALIKQLRAKILYIWIVATNVHRP